MQHVKFQRNLAMDGWFRKISPILKRSKPPDGS